MPEGGFDGLLPSSGSDFLQPFVNLLEKADALCKDATFTLEVTAGDPEILWLLEENILED